MFTLLKKNLKKINSLIKKENTLKIIKSNNEIINIYSSISNKTKKNIFSNKINELLKNNNVSKIEDICILCSDEKYKINGYKKIKLENDKSINIYKFIYGDKLTNYGYIYMKVNISNYSHTVNNDKMYIIFDEIYDVNFKNVKISDLKMTCELIKKMKNTRLIETSCIEIDLIELKYGNSVLCCIFYYIKNNILKILRETIDYFKLAMNRINYPSCCIQCKVFYIVTKIAIFAILIMIIMHVFFFCKKCDL